MTAATSTLFFDPSMAVFPEDVSDPSYAKWVDYLSYQGHYQLSLRQIDAVTLTNVNDSYALIAPSTASWQFLIIACQGSALLETTGHDTDNTTTIHGYQPIYGTAIFPGYLVLSTYNLTAASTIVALAAGTALQIFAAVAVEDGT